jgi:nucleotide-binding universal stress UspA family protein
MAISNHDRVGKALDLLKEGLRPFVEREMKAQHAHLWFEQAKASVSESQAHLFGTEDEPRWDVAATLAVMWNQWNDVFRKTLGHAERSLASELREVRNRWAHQEPFSGDDAYRALDSAGRLLTALSASQADEVEKMKMELLRVRFDEQVRSERRRSAGTAIESQASSSLRPWREVVTPHQDVASGRYQQAEFAANRGVEDRRVKLGCVMPGESPAVFGDALRRLSAAATYLYQDGPRYWYSTQPTVTKLAEDRAEQLKRNPDAVAQELDKRLRADLRKTGDFRRIHPLPQSGQDVPEATDARLVVLGSDYPSSLKKSCSTSRRIR